MRNSFPVALCVIGSIIDFALWTKLRHFEVREHPHKSLVGLSREERQRRVTTASWILFGSGWIFLVGAVVLFWLGNSR